MDAMGSMFDAAPEVALSESSVSSANSPTRHPRDIPVIYLGQPGNRPPPPPSEAAQRLRRAAALKDRVAAERGAADERELLEYHMRVADAIQVPEMYDRYGTIKAVRDKEGNVLETAKERQRRMERLTKKIAGNLTGGMATGAAAFHTSAPGPPRPMGYEDVRQDRRQGRRAAPGERRWGDSDEEGSSEDENAEPAQHPGYVESPPNHQLDARAGGPDSPRTKRRYLELAKAVYAAPPGAETKRMVEEMKRQVHGEDYEALAAAVYESQSPGDLADRVERMRQGDVDRKERIYREKAWNLYNTDIASPEFSRQFERVEQDDNFRRARDEPTEQDLRLVPASKAQGKFQKRRIKAQKQNKYAVVAYTPDDLSGADARKAIEHRKRKEEQLAIREHRSVVKPETDDDSDSDKSTDSDDEDAMRARSDRDHARFQLVMQAFLVVLVSVALVIPVHSLYSVHTECQAPTYERKKTFAMPSRNVKSITVLKERGPVKVQYVETEGMKNSTTMQEYLDDVCGGYCERARAPNAILARRASPTLSLADSWRCVELDMVTKGQIGQQKLVKPTVFVKPGNARCVDDCGNMIMCPNDVVCCDECQACDTYNEGECVDAASKVVSRFQKLCKHVDCGGNGADVSGPCYATATGEPGDHNSDGRVTVIEAECRTRQPVCRGAQCRVNKVPYAWEKSNPYTRGCRVRDVETSARCRVSNLEPAIKAAIQKPKNCITITWFHRARTSEGLASISTTISQSAGKVKLESLWPLEFNGVTHCTSSEILVQVPTSITEGIAGQVRIWDRIAEKYYTPAGKDGLNFMVNEPAIDVQVRASVPSSWLMPMLGDVTIEMSQQIVLARARFVTNAGSISVSKVAARSLFAQASPGSVHLKVVDSPDVNISALANETFSNWSATAATVGAGVIVSAVNLGATGGLMGVPKKLEQKLRPDGAPVLGNLKVTTELGPIALNAISNGQMQILVEGKEKILARNPFLDTSVLGGGVTMELSGTEWQGRFDLLSRQGKVDVKLPKGGGCDDMRDDKRTANTLKFYFEDSPGSGYPQFGESGQRRTARLGNLNTSHIMWVDAAAGDVALSMTCKEYKKCPVDCDMRGSCNGRSGVCSCFPWTPFYGPMCNYLYCPNGCTSRGQCNPLLGTCKCNARFYPEQQHLKSAVGGKMPPGTEPCRKVLCTDSPLVDNSKVADLQGQTFGTTDQRNCGECALDPISKQCSAAARSVSFLAGAALIRMKLNKPEVKLRGDVSSAQDAAAMASTALNLPALRVPGAARMAPESMFERSRFLQFSRVFMEMAASKVLRGLFEKTSHIMNKTSVLVDEITLEFECPNNCSQPKGVTLRGTCDTYLGVCACKKEACTKAEPPTTCDNYFRDDCRFGLCPRNCSGRGWCSYSTGKCNCNFNVGGLACEKPNLKCAGEVFHKASFSMLPCNNRGVCNTLIGACTCTKKVHSVSAVGSWTGADCNVYQHPCLGDINTTAAAEMGTVTSYDGKTQVNKVSGAGYVGWNGVDSPCDHWTGPQLAWGGIRDAVKADWRSAGAFCTSACNATVNPWCDEKGTIVNGKIELTGVKKCICPRGWYGYKCATKIPIPCPGGNTPPKFCNAAVTGVSGNLACNFGTGKCTCKLPYFGADCKKRYCPNDCYSAGNCIFATNGVANGTCICNRWRTGVDCSIRMCPESDEAAQHAILKNVSTLAAITANETAAVRKIGCKQKGHGALTTPNKYCDVATGVCHCVDGAIGTACQEILCPGQKRRFQYAGKNLHGKQKIMYLPVEGVICNFPRGVCNYTTGTCLCKNSGEKYRYIYGAKISATKHLYDYSWDVGYEGPACELKECPGANRTSGWDAVKNSPSCSGQGKCNGATGKCTCDAGAGGMDCLWKICPKDDDPFSPFGDCAGNGVCNYKFGNCSCYQGIKRQNGTCLPNVCPSVRGQECAGNGKCDFTTGKCKCTRMAAIGDACEKVACPGLSGGTYCWGNGACDETNGECTCKKPWGDADCSRDTVKSPGQCTLTAPCKNGATCVEDGTRNYKCKCQPGFEGTNCQTKIKKSGGFFG